MAEKLKLLILYHQTNNEYQLISHNRTPQEGRKFVSEWDEHLVEGTTLIALDQMRRHGAGNAQRCKACRETVKRSSGLEPKPKFTRREQ